MSAFILLIVLIITNGVFAMSEIAIVSARKVRLQQRAERGDSQARAALELANEPNQFLSTVQVGITLIGVTAGAFGEATLSVPLKARLSLIPWLEPYSDLLSLGLVVAGITYLSLVIGELAPKQLALYNPERIARAVAIPMRTLSVITFPVVRLLSLSTTTLLRLLGARPSTEPPVTEDEIAALIEQGTAAGVFDLAEQTMVAGVFGLNDQRVNTLMTPRPEIVWLDLADPPQESARKISESPYSRFPVCQDNLDNMIGIVQSKDLLVNSLRQQRLNLKVDLRQPLFVPETLPASRMLKLFPEAGTQLALVLDEYGGIQGLVTLNDLVEAIIGEMELMQPQAVQRQDGSWLLGGLLPIAEFKSIFNLETGLEEENNYQTLGGFIMAHLGRIPADTDCFQWAGLSIEVLDMDGKRVDKVLVTPLQAEAVRPQD